MITKNYIKMCEKAKEIQKLRYYKRGDWFYFEKHKDDYTKGFHVISDGYAVESYNDNYITRSKGVWLPTQEQLQGMILISKKYTDMFILNNFLCDFMIDDLNKKNRRDMNEVWLAFVYKEIYNKIWTGKDWVKEGK